MPIFEQVILTPNRYHIGGGRYADLTAQDLQEYVQGTQEILQAGIRLSVPSEHPLPGSPEGAPVEEEIHQFSDAIRNAGWLKDIWQDEDGAVVARYEVTSQQYADAIRDGSIKYSSPELRESWTTGNRRKFGRHFSHFALTPKPRNEDQEPLAEVAQFSLSEVVPTKKSKQHLRSLLSELGMKVPRGPIDLGDEDLENTTSLLTKAVALSGIQFAEITDSEDQAATSKQEGAKPPKMENPDMPPAANTGDVNAAIIAHLSELGVELPSDFDLAEDFRVLLAALKTASAAQRKAEEAAEEKEQNAPTIEEEPMPAGSQFSDEANAVIAKKNELLATYQRDKLKSLVAGCRVPGIHQNLAERLEAVQFSDEGDEEPTLTISQVVEMVNSAIPETMTFSSDDVSDPKPPEGMSELSEAELDEEIDSFLGRTGYAKAVAASK